jgi:hypothetical protein
MASSIVVIPVIRVLIDAADIPAAREAMIQRFSPGSIKSSKRRTDFWQ